MRQTSTISRAVVTEMCQTDVVFVDGDFFSNDVVNLVSCGNFESETTSGEVLTRLYAAMLAELGLGSHKDCVLLLANLDLRSSGHADEDSVGMMFSFFLFHLFFYDPLVIGRRYCSVRDGGSLVSGGRW